mgnify:CR=1 FL=1
MYLTTDVTARHSCHLSAKNLGTGNVMFQIASVYGIAKRIGRIGNFDTIKEYCDHIRKEFGVNHGDTLYRNCRADSSIYELLIYDGVLEKTFNNELFTWIRNNSKVNIRIWGHLECPLYFNQYRSEILDLFSPDQDSQLYINTKYPELGSRNCVSIHIRMGIDSNTKCDYVYYQRAIDYINKNVDDPLYLIFSDGSPDIGQLTMPSYRVVDSNPDYIDLWTMSQCLHNIINYSTFSWWGAYLNTNDKKIITYPRSTVKYISSKNSMSEDLIRDTYFISGVQIEDTE